MVGKKWEKLLTKWRKVEKSGENVFIFDAEIKNDHDKPDRRI